jgi:hypothetical protein
LERWLRKEKKMLKKSLIAIALLAIVMPAFAVDPTVLDQKFHKPWPGKVVTTYNWQDVQSINVVMDVGYWIEIKYTGDIKIAQDATLGDPFFSYSGCINNVAIKSNFAATIKGTVATSPEAHALGIDDGDNKVVWGATINGASSYDVVGGAATVSICVTGKSLHIDKLTQADNYRIAILTISVIPTEYKGTITETF